MKKAIIGFVVVAAVLGSLLYWQLQKREAEAARPPGSSGTIEGQEYTVSPRLGGRIAAINVEEGQSVKAGQVLVEIDCAEPEAGLAEAHAALEAANARKGQAEAQLAAARNGVEIASRQTSAAGAQVRATRSQSKVLNEQIENARRTVARLETLRKSGGGTAAQLDDARTRLAVLQKQQDAANSGTQAARAQKKAVAGGEISAESQVALAEAGVSMALADIKRAEATVQRASTVVDDCTVEAAGDGVVQLRAYEPGEMVMPGAKVLTVVNTRVVEATFYLGNEHLEQARPGTVVKVVADAMPDTEMTGEIVHVSESAEFTPRNIQTREDRQRLVYAVDVVIPNEEGKLHPGMPVEIWIAED